MREIQSNSQAKWYMFVAVSGVVVFILGCVLGSWKVIAFGAAMILGWFKGLQGIYWMIVIYFMYKKQKEKEIKALFSELEMEELNKKNQKMVITKNVGNKTMKNLLGDDFRVSIPDDNFQSYLYKEGIIVLEGTVAYGDIKGISKVSCHQIDIWDLEGIQYFTALTELYCYSNNLTSLDLSKNAALTVLHCEGNQLTSLDVSKNTALTTLDCGDNKATSLDVRKNTALTKLCCYSNKLTSLDVSKNNALTELECQNNQLTSLDVSKNAALTQLWCEDNQLTSLDLSKNTALTELACWNNQLTSLDVSKNAVLTELYCEDNKFDCVALKNKFGLK